VAVIVRLPPWRPAENAILVPVAWTPSTLAVPSGLTVAWWVWAKLTMALTSSRAAATLASAPLTTEAAVDGRAIEIHGLPTIEARPGIWR
jgi:hypothetical protein